MKKEIEYIETEYYSLRSLREPALLDDFLILMDKYSSEFGVKGITTSFAERPRYKPIIKDSIVSEINKKGNEAYIRFGANKPYNIKIDFNIDDGEIINNRYNFSSVSLRIDRKYFFSNIRRKVDAWLDFCIKLYDIFEPLFAFSHDSADSASIYGGTGNIKQPHLNCPVVGIFWANFFGPCCIDYFGRARILQAPGADKIEKLKMEVC